MYTLSSWKSHLGIVAVNLSHQEYSRVMLDLRAINKSARFESPGVWPESAVYPPIIRLESGLPTRISGRNRSKSGQTLLTG